MDEYTEKEQEVWGALAHVVDPELHMNIVDLGLVYKIEVDGGSAHIEMTLTSPGCPFGPYLLHQVNEAASAVEGIREAQVDIVWEPAWGPDKMSEEARLELGFDI
jgi:metal-sulfur cluster biosynthetic enzyme